MESLAYLHLALSYEEPETELKLQTLPSLKCGSELAIQLLIISVLIGFSSSASYASSLQRGMSGPEVTALQEKLQALGYFEPCPTGYFGEATQEAAQRFQRDRGLAADGVIGSQTQAALSNSSGQRSPQASTFDPSPFTTQTPASTTTPEAQNFEDRPFTTQNPSPSPRVDNRPLPPQNPSPAATPEAQNFEEPLTPYPQASTFDTRPFTSPTETPQTPAATEEPSLARSSNTPSPSVRESASYRGIVRLGDRAPEVGTLQNALRQAGFYQGETSGYFDAATEEAVINFQQAYGLSADGIVGSQTQNLLLWKNSTSPSTAATPTTSRNLVQRGDSGESVTHLQQALTVAGFYDGPITGYFGSLTEAALLDFQQAKGINVDGVAGPATQSALMNYSSSVVASNKGVEGNFRESFSVLQLQERLQARGLYDGSLDGIDGPLTQAAVAAATQRYLVSESEIRNGRF